MHPYGRLRLVVDSVNENAACSVRVFARMHGLKLRLLSRLKLPPYTVAATADHGSGVQRDHRQRGHAGLGEARGMGEGKTVPFHQCVAG